MGPLSNYTAPALQKGLDILEHLASSAAPVSMSQLAQQMGRTVPELYRMLLVLSDRGYVEDSGHGYAVTPKAFGLGLARPDIQRLLNLAAPEMERLSQTTGQACYLTTADDRFVVVIAAQPSEGEFGVAVRIGMRQQLLETAAGLVHFGFQPNARKDKWAKALADSEDADRLAQFLKHADRAAASGQAERPHRHMDCLTELSSPVTTASGSVFALSLLYLRQIDSVDLMACRSELSQSARRISQDLRFQQVMPEKARQSQAKQTAEVCG